MVELMLAHIRHKQELEKQKSINEEKKEQNAKDIYK